MVPQIFLPQNCVYKIFDIFFFCKNFFLSVNLFSLKLFKLQFFTFASHGFRFLVLRQKYSCDLNY